MATCDMEASSCTTGDMVKNFECNEELRGEFLGSRAWEFVSRMPPEELVSMGRRL